MRKYLVKKKFTPEGEELEHSVWKVSKMKISSKYRPRGREFVFIEGVVTEYPIVFQNEDGGYEIVEDPAAMDVGEALKDLESSIRIKLERMEFGRRVIAIIFIISDGKDLTKLQKNSFRQTFSAIRKQLHDGSIIDAEELISNLIPDDVIIEENDKTVIINEIENNKSRLGY